MTRFFTIGFATISLATGCGAADSGSDDASSTDATSALESVVGSSESAGDYEGGSQKEAFTTTTGLDPLKPLSDLTSDEATTACAASNAELIQNYSRNSRGWCTLGGAHASLNEAQCSQSVETCISTFDEKLVKPPSCTDMKSKLEDCAATVWDWEQCIDATVTHYNQVLPQYQCSMTGDADALQRVNARFETPSVACTALQAQCPLIFAGGHSRSAEGT